MRRLLRPPAAIAVALIASAALGACADDEPTGHARSRTLAIVVQAPDSISVGSSVALSVVLLNATRADTGSPFWSAGPEHAVTITQGGVLTARAAGQAWVSARMSGAAGTRGVLVY